MDLKCVNYLCLTSLTCKDWPSTLQIVVVYALLCALFCVILFKPFTHTHNLYEHVHILAYVNCTTVCFNIIVPVMTK